ncbi:endo-1,4-beta xylanase [Pholiota conissans]|uniref:Beta-xylanase n=1 Tax=Pholiota conissans TaxID=109636 RepID=A0A9P5YZ93_9AGAR|nr:endo-1,4-beta xylanase [Pholiota conissans]
MTKTTSVLLPLLLSIPLSIAQLNTLAQAAGKLYFGTATDNPELTNTSYVAQLQNTLDFHQLTPANSMKWDATEPSQGVFTFNGGDQIVTQAKTHGQIMRGHNCVWHNQLPDWVTAGNFDNATLLSIVQNHCGTLVGHYKGQIYAWDVINEAFNDDGTFRESVFFTTTGTSYIPTALRAARAADPNAKLYINDFNIEGTGAKSTALANLVKQLKADGVPIDGIGVQTHLIVGEVPTTLQQNLQNFADLGVEVAITELDIRMTLPETPVLIAQQTADYQTVIEACKAVSGCIGVTLWDWTDKFSWVPGTFAGQGAACPWDENFLKKPAYQGIVEGWQS